MIVLCLISALGVVFFLNRKADLQMGLLFSFYLLFIFLAIRVELGSDYAEYAKSYNELSVNPSMNVERTEMGWVYLNRLFSSIFPFQILIALLSFLYCLAYFKMIKKWGIPKFYYLSILILFINPNLTLIQSSALRQALAIVIFLFSLKYLFTQKYIRYICCVIGASMFHLTAINLLLLPIILFFLKKMNFFAKSMIFLLFVSLVILKNIYVDVFANIVALFFGARYDLLLVTNSNFSLLNFIIYSALMLMLLYYYEYQEENIKPFFILTIIGLFFFPLDLIIPLSGRLGYYYFPLSVISYPYLINSLPSVIFKRMFIIVLVFIYSYRLYGIYVSETYSGAFNTYKTIFNR